MTEDQLFDEAERRMATSTGISTVSRNSALRIAREIGEADFLDSTPGQWLEAYRKARPNSSVDLGKDRVNAIKCLMYTMRTIRKEERETAAKERADREALEREQAELKAKAEAEHEAEVEQEARKNPRFSQAQIKALSDFMELSSIKSVDLKLAQDFIRAFTVKE